MKMDPRLLEAARFGDVSQLKLLADEDPHCLHGATIQKNTALHIASGLGNTWFAVEMCNRRPLLLIQTNTKGDTPLHCAARSGQRFLVSFFTGCLKGVFRTGKGIVEEEVQNLVRMRNKDGSTALHEAVRYGHRGVVMELMKVDPELATFVTDFGESPLYLAAERSSLEIVELLLQSTRIVSGGPGGKTALHAAVCRNHDVAQVLLVKMPDLNRQVDISSSTALHYIASQGDVKMVQLLLEFDPSIAHICDKDGLSPIHVAASMGHIHVIGKLIEICPDSSELIDKKGKNFLHVAVEKKRANLVKYVLQMPLLHELVNERDYEGNTPLHLATINCNQEIVQILLANPRVATNVTNHKGLTPLDIASSCVEPFIALRMNKIREDLVWAGTHYSPQRLDIMTNKLQRNKEEEINRCRAIANNLSIVAVLIATVSFAAAFTLPGGYQNNAGPEEGLAVLAKKAAFKAFLIADTVAMVSSLTITCLLVNTGSFDHDVRLHSIRTSMRLMRVANGGMVVAFATGTYVVIPSDLHWLAILICVVVCSVPVAVWMIACWPAFGSFRIIARADRDQAKNEISVEEVKLKGRNLFHMMLTGTRLHSITDVQTPYLSRTSWIDD